MGSTISDEDPTFLVEIRWENVKSIIGVLMYLLA